MSAQQTPMSNDLFVTTLLELGNEAPVELVARLRAQLEHISSTNPNRAQTARSCLKGLGSEVVPTYMHVLTAAYLINGGVMLKEDGSSLTEDLELEAFERELQDLHLETGCGEESPLCTDSKASHKSPADAQ